MSGSANSGRQLEASNRCAHCVLVCLFVRLFSGQTLVVWEKIGRKLRNRQFSPRLASLCGCGVGEQREWSKETALARSNLEWRQNKNKSGLDLFLLRIVSQPVAVQRKPVGLSARELSKLEARERKEFSLLKLFLVCFLLGQKALINQA